MEFDRKELLKILNVAKLAIDQKNYIPILSHFVFSGKSITAYDDLIGIQISLKTNFVCALKADVLLKLVSSVHSETISIGGTDKTVYFKAGVTRKGVRARLPYMSEEDFFFKMPSLRRLQSFEISEAQAKKFFLGLELCLSSIGEGQPVLEAVTVCRSKSWLRMYSTNNKAISRYAMKIDDVEVFGKDILPAQFCKAAIKGSEVYGFEGIKIFRSKDAILISFNRKCRVYSKLIPDTEPIDFESVISAHVPKGYKKKLQKWNDDFPEGFKRTQIIFSEDEYKMASVEIDKNVLVIEAKSSLGKLKSSAEFKKDLRKRTGRFKVDVELVLKAIENTDSVFLADNAMLFAKGTYTHLIGTQTASSPKAAPISDDEIPF